MTRGETKQPRLCVTIPSMHGAGCERMLAEVLPFYSERFSVDLVLLEGRINYEIPDKVNVVSLDTPLSGFTGAQAAMLSLRRHLKKENYAAVVSYLDLYNALVSLALMFWPRRPAHVACEHTTDREYFFHSRMPAWKQIGMKRALKFAYGRADRVIAVSENVKDFLVRDLGIDRPIDVIHNAVDPAKFNLLPADTSRIDERYLAAKTRLLCISRLDHQKNIPFLLESFSSAAERIPDATLFILGDGPDRRSVEEMIVELGLLGRVILLGFRQNPQDYLKMADVFALASRYESFGNVIVEAMACGVPVVTTNYGAVVKEILTDGTAGRIVEQGDRQAFAEAIVDVLGDEKSDLPAISSLTLQRFSMGEKAQQYIAAVEAAIKDGDERRTQR